MLAQNFKTPANLDISDAEFDALVKVLGMLERGELVHVRLRGVAPTSPNAFNLSSWDCGTAHCIGGWADLIGDVSFRRRGDLPEGLSRLFWPDDGEIMTYRQMNTVTPAQAAIALRSYLTTGEPNWEEALA